MLNTDINPLRISTPTEFCGLAALPPDVRKGCAFPKDLSPKSFAAMPPQGA